MHAHRGRPDRDARSRLLDLGFPERHLSRLGLRRTYTAAGNIGLGLANGSSGTGFSNFGGGTTALSGFPYAAPSGVPQNSVLDPLNRTENPLVGATGVEWGQYVSSNDGTTTVKDDGSTAITITDGSYGTAYWKKTDFSGDVECFAKVGTNNVTDYLLYGRVTNPNGVNVTGYGGYWSAGGTVWVIESLDSGNTENVWAQGPFKNVWTPGDLIGITVVGASQPVITLFLNETPIGAWADTREPIHPWLARHGNG